MGSSVGPSKEPGNQASAESSSKQPWCKERSGSPGHKIIHGKPIGVPKAPVGSPKISKELTKPSSGGKLSSFMQPTAASASKAKANADSYMNNLAAGNTRSPVCKRNRRSTIPVQEDKVLLEPGNPALAALKKPREKLVSPAAGTEHLQATTQQSVGKGIEATGSEHLSPPCPPSNNSQFELVPGFGLNIGHLVTPPEFYNRPASSVAIHLRATPTENLDAGVFGDLRRMVLELRMQIRGEYSDNQSVQSWNQSANYGTMTTDFNVGQVRPHEQPSEQGLRTEFERYQPEPDPEHNLVIIVGLENIAFSLNSDVIAGHSYTIRDVIEQMGIPADDEIKELVFPEINPYGFFYILQALFTSTFPAVETDGRKAEALMMDAALYLHMPRVATVLRNSMAAKLKDETLDIEVALRFANSLYKHGTANDIRDFWHEDAFVRRSLRQTNLADLIERSPDIFDDRTWMVPGFKHGLGDLLGKTFLRI
ncbi:hypothetical protein TWF506_004417 [Arthrobotrys conoides]|uniref:BTB domain-containing protein n=1 Tax=Arthrobotrys conoides TaxID=74498 RepID=A0AAN8N330_9PEZI